jgi:hypothetical protein
VLRVLDVGLDFLRIGRSEVVREMRRSKRERGIAEKWLGCTSSYRNRARSAAGLQVSVEGFRCG